MRCASRSVALSEVWLSEAQSEPLRPLLPAKVRAVARVDDRRGISGVSDVVEWGGWVVEAARTIAAGVLPVNDRV